MFRSFAGDPPERCANNRSTRAHASALVVVVAGDDENERAREHGFDAQGMYICLARTAKSIAKRRNDGPCSFGSPARGSIMYRAPRERRVWRRRLLPDGVDVKIRGGCSREPAEPVIGARRWSSFPGADGHGKVSLTTPCRREFPSRRRVGQEPGKRENRGRGDALVAEVHPDSLKFRRPRPPSSSELRSGGDGFSATMTTTTTTPPLPLPTTRTTTATATTMARWHPRKERREVVV